MLTKVTASHPDCQALLNFLYQAKYATTKQIARLLFSNSPTYLTMIRRANLITRRLKNDRKIFHLKRRIGGVRSGSGSFVWSLTHQGLKELQKHQPTIVVKRRNAYEPTEHHLAHTLAITELYVRLKELDHQSNVQLERFEFEPNSWRSFADIAGSSQSLKPDAFIKLVVGEYEDSYFIELDRATESLTRVINKCKHYIYYYRLGIEQRMNEVFPMVLWVVPDDKRKLAILQRIQTELTEHWQLFNVVSLDEFNDYIEGGVQDDSATEN